MARWRRRRVIQPYRLLVAGLVLVGGVFLYRWWPSPAKSETPPVLGTDEASAAPPKLRSELPSRPEPTRLSDAAPPRAEARLDEPKNEPAPDSARQRRVESLIAAGRQALGQNDLLAARARWSEALKLGASAADAATLRAELERIAEQTILAPAVTKGDPLTESYVVKSGDTLGKLAKAQHITAELIQRVNHLSDKHMIRVGQTLKLIHGPFHAVVAKNSFGMDVFCQDIFVKRFPVGLGQDDSTPSGLWKVTGKLVDPTWYPPRGGEIIAAGDPKNPLAHRWIGLVGLEGSALGQQRYGIHGTTDPDSVGKTVSLGCIRMHNPDVELLYDLLIEEQSRVRVEGE